MKEEAYIILMEECGELIQACSKMIRSKGHERYLKDLKNEIGDVLTLIEVLRVNNIVSDEEIENRMEIKIEKLKKWSSLFNE